MNKWKNYKLWVAIFAFIPMLLQAFGVDVLPKDYTQLVNSLLGILVLIGIVNNPEGITSSNTSENNKTDK